MMQYIIAGVSLIIFVCLVVFGAPNFGRECARMVKATTLVAAIGCVSAFCYDVPIDYVIRLMLPFVLFIIGLWTASVAANSLRTTSGLVNGMVCAGVISLCFRYYYATKIAGIDLDSMRYQVESPVICSMVAYIAASMCFAKRLSLTAIAIAAITTVVVAISVTRSYLLTIGFTCIGIPLLLWRGSWGSSVHRQFRLWRLVGLGICAFGTAGGLIVSAYLRPDLFKLWDERIHSERVMTYKGEDVNVISRIAEAKGIWTITTATPMRFLFGNGFGNAYQWDYDYAGEVGSVSEEMVFQFFVPVRYASHSAFTYAFFFGGVFGLVWQFYAFAKPLLSSWRYLIVMKRISSPRVLQIVGFSFLSVFLYISQSITSNPFGERMAGLYIGFSAGILLSLPKLFDASGGLQNGMDGRGDLGNRQ